MADEIMNDEYPDEKQRWAICNSLWGKERSMKILELRGAIGIHHTGLSDKAWDGPKAKANLKNDGNAAYYRKAFAWVDPEGDKDVKASYKFIHHEVSSDGVIGAANIRGCQATIAILNGARGGTKIPDKDRKGVYNHVAAHLKDGDIEPAELKSTTEEIEIRTFTELELRTDEGEKPKLFGYAALFNELSEPLAGFREKIKKGAFTKTLEEDDIRMLFNHDPNYVLGRTGNGTLELEEKAKGLYFEVEPPETSWAKDLIVSVKRGDLHQNSFGFYTIKDLWDNSDPDNVIRTLLEVRLFDTSIVTFPAYPKTSVKVRSAGDVYRQYLDELRENKSREESKWQERIAIRKKKLELMEKE